MPPEPANPIDGEYDASGPARGCIQPLQALGNPLIVKYDEDCLYLDIWVPEGKLPGTLPTEKLSVIVR